MSTSQTPKRQKVIIDHDGGIDDLVAMIILAAYPNQCDLLGVVCIDADCFIEEAVEVSGKVLSAMQLYGRERYASSPSCDDAEKAANDSPFEYLSKVPVGRSTLTAINEFPREWRADAIKMNDLPCVNTDEVITQWDKNGRHEVYADEDKKAFKAGEELLAELVMKKGSPTDKVTVCVTGPLSNVAYCITKYGKAFTDNLEAVVVMGGAIDVEGNVFQSTFNKTSTSYAEWNIYWDAPSAKTVLESDAVKVILFALDATNHVPVHSEFVKRFGTQKKIGPFLSEFVGSSWAMCTYFQAVFGPTHAYYAWDALTAAWVVRPEMAEDLEKVPIKVIVAADDADAAAAAQKEGKKAEDMPPKQEGRTLRLTPEEAISAGINSNVYLPKKVNAKDFYDMMIEIGAKF